MYFVMFYTFELQACLKITTLDFRKNTKNRLKSMTRKNIVIKFGVKMTEQMCWRLEESQETPLIKPIALMEENLTVGYLIKGKSGKLRKFSITFF